MKLPPIDGLVRQRRVPPVQRHRAVDHDIFRKIVVRESRIPRIEPADFSVKGWTERSYYEVCTDPAIYAALEKRKGAGRG